MKAILFSLAIIAVCCTTATAQYRNRDNNRNHRVEYRGQNRYNYPVNRYPSIPRYSVMIPYRNYNYHYSDGYFYRPYGASFRIVIPPVGIFINILPKGYRRIHYPGGYCYYYGGTYYREYDNRYEVIDAPRGAEVPELLSDAKEVTINNDKLYEANGTYYKQEVNSAGDITYKVMGKAGDIDAPKNPATLQVGDQVQQLPEGCKTIVLSGKKLYVSPDNVYYEEVIQQNSVAYKVVGNEVK